MIKTVKVPDDKKEEVKAGKLKIDGVDLRTSDGRYAGKLEDISEEFEEEKSSNNPNFSSDALYAAVGALLASGISVLAYKGHLLSTKQKTLIDKLESTIHPYSGTILKNIYNRESVAALSEFLATVQEITEIKFPIFIKSSKLGWWDSFVSVIHLYTTLKN